MATTGEPSRIKSSISLNSSDLISRFLAATPSYFFDISQMQHNFVFSEMLRSFVQAKNDSLSAQSTTNSTRRRLSKKSWRSTRDRPLELTSKEKNRSNLASPSPTSHYYSLTKANEMQQQQQRLFDNYQNNYYSLNTSSDSKANKDINRIYNPQEFTKDFVADTNNLKSELNNKCRDKNEHVRKYFAEKHTLTNQNKNVFQDMSAIKTDGIKNLKSSNNDEDNPMPDYESSSVNNSFTEQAKRIDFIPKHIFSSTPERSDNFQSPSTLNLPNGTPEYLPNPLWYPSYPLVQTYPSIDPLHFFIDLRVSGHIWDRKTNEKYLFNRNKHNSAFVVPQSKEFNKPLNLTRNETVNSRYELKNRCGTQYLFKNIKEIYQKIWNSENVSKNNVTNEIFEENAISLKVSNMNSQDILDEKSHCSLRD